MNNSRFSANISLPSLLLLVVIYIDIFGNEKRKVRTLKDFKK